MHTNNLCYSYRLYLHFTLEWSLARKTNVIWVGLESRVRSDYGYKAYIVYSKYVHVTLMSSQSPASVKK